ncbi:TPA: hypothetical protein SID20_001589, partial [Pasteurella multocida]|nr:hypothetical protein [Pasteurella multocida]HEH9766495.1 hypothetical protein [Pasteurella multocida]HEH9827014.1 hypothetical protein [Pasteurella multocida]
RHQHIPEYKNLLDERKLQKQKAEQVMAEKQRYKSNKDAGILQKMSNSLKPSTSKNTTSQLPYYAIPAIQNLWNNIKVK